MMAGAGDPLPGPVLSALTTMGESVTRLIPSAIAVVLGGSFGRGEGVVRNDQIVNDLDCVAIVKRPLSWYSRRRIREIRDETSKAIGDVHLDINVFTTEQLRAKPTSMLLHDLRFGGKVLCGPEDVLSIIPAQHGEAVSRREACNLLTNRLVTLLEAHPLLDRPGGAIRALRQLAKVDYALIDFAIHCSGHHYTSYVEKEKALLTLLQAPEISRLATRRDFRQAAWEYRLSAREQSPREMLDQWAERCNDLVEALHRCVNRPNNEPLSSHLRIGESNLFKRILALILCRPYFIDVEREIARMLESYPFRSISDPTVPSLRDRARWISYATTLVKAWYLAIR